MAVIDKKLIHFINLATFEQRLNAGDIKDTSIVFIQDAKRIWTHGQYYSSPYTKEEIDQLFVGSNVTLDGYSKDGVAEIVATDTVNSAFGKVEDYLDSLSDLNAVLVDTGDVASDPIINDYIKPSDLSKVATSGSYNDLLDKPTIPSTVTESTVSGWGFTKNTGTYSKPSGGIPKSDLATAVQTSLNNADYYVGNNNVTSVTSIPVSKRLVIANISSSQSLSLASNLSAGKEVHIIIYNSGSSSISIALPNTGNYKCLVDTALSIDAQNYAEINIISDGTNMYIRAI